MAIQYVNIDRIFSKLTRDLKGTELNESDVIEWIGEALEFLQVPQVLEEKVKFLKVKNNHLDMPSNLHMITQIARFKHYPKVDRSLFSEEAKYRNYDEVLNEDPCPVPLSNICEPEFLDLDWTYHVWTTSEYYKQNYEPVRLSTNTFFNSLVCKEKDMSIYNSCDSEYTIVGSVDRKIRFSFTEGDVAISYLRNSVDEETGYPLIPDNVSYITAIVYFVKWKIAEMHDWSGRDGWTSKAERAEERWLKYARQAKNIMKMPKTLDEYQNLLEQTHYLIPNHKRYYGFFGNLNKTEERNFHSMDKSY